MKKIKVLYYASMREQVGKNNELMETQAHDAAQLFEFLREKYSIALSKDILKVAVNNEFVSWKHPLKDGDEVVFIPPVSGG